MIQITTKRMFEVGTKIEVDGIVQDVIEIDFCKGIKISVEIPGLSDNEIPVRLDDWIHWSEMANISRND